MKTLKNFKSILLLFISFSTAVGFTSCSKDDSEPDLAVQLKNNWEVSSYDETLYVNGTKQGEMEKQTFPTGTYFVAFDGSKAKFSNSSQNWPYTLSGNKIIVDSGFWNQAYPMTTTFSIINNDKIIVEGIMEVTSSGSTYKTVLHYEANRVK
jgi:hypothetical protein